ncbi:DsbA family protein [Psychromonas algicola]|uniref:DsbA family protein n=1 Tax=Psychromonas algicola TaxID=2555642 RepID=UPI0010679CA9|nr:thioredoxin domain-containing protein [Psychromonas sp. RZ5]TEW49822.1 hypothetical protein E2R67_10135 [Psychromonas sp. RZ5]
MDNTLSMYIIAGVITLTIITLPLLYKRYRSKQSSAKYSLYVRSYSPIIGPQKAKVTVSLFLDPACINSKVAYQGISARINKYEGKIKFAIRYGAFFSNSMKAIAILEAAKSQKMQKKVMDIVFKDPSVWENGNSSDLELLYVQLEKNGVDIKRLKRDMNHPKISTISVQELVDANHLKIKQTPTYFVNEHAIGSFGLHFLEDLIKREIKLNYE